MKIYHGWRESTYGLLHIGLTEKGICWIGLEVSGDPSGQGRTESERRMRAHFPQAEFLSAQAADLPDMDAPHSCGSVDLHGTAFQRRVWAALLQVRRGETKTYGDIARSIGQPEAARAVGGAVGANPVSILVPCHRILPAGGGVGHYGWGADLKRRILEIEGVYVP